MSEKSDKTLEIKVSRVLSAAEKCPDWNAGLKEMFPEAFEDKVKPVRLKKDGEIREVDDGYIVWVHRDKNKIFLDAKYNWRLIQETDDQYAELVPTRKS